jgi:uncharacterized protein GlcG (DUF336 family)
MRLAVEQLEARTLLDATAVLAAGTLAVVGGPGREVIDIALDPAGGQIVVADHGREVGRFDPAAVERITLQGGPDDNVLRIEPEVTQPAVILGGGGDNLLIAGGGPTTLQGGPGRNKLVAGPGPDALLGGPGTDLIRAPGGDLIDGGPGRNLVLDLGPGNTIVPRPGDEVADPTLAAAAAAAAQMAGVADSDPLSASDVEGLLDRASAATASTDAIIAVTDRNGRILGVRVEPGVAPEVQDNPATLTFSVDGAVALARTGAFFANDQAPLTSRLVRFISQSTITQREVQSSPDGTDPDSLAYGPGFVAPVGVGGHFPPGIAETPQVDLFEIEHTNRDGSLHRDAQGNLVALPERFNIDPAYVPDGQTLYPPDSYGTASGLLPDAQGRGIGTLPGGIPIYKNGELVGGIGVFFPGKTGYATEENSSLSADYDPTRPDRSLEAEFMAVAAVGGAPGIGIPVGDLPGAPLVPGILGLPLTPDLMRIDLVGITLDIVGPGGTSGPARLVSYGLALGLGAPTGRDLPVDTAGDTLRDGLPVPTGWLVTPHDGVGITAAEVTAVITHGVAQALQTRAAIRLPQDSTARMVFAVTDRTGAVLGLFRMPDATVFSIDVAVAKARNVAYYADPTALQPQDELPGVPGGVAFTNRTFRYLAEPRFPEGIDGAPPGPFSQLNDGGADPLTGLQAGAPLPPSAFQSVLGYDSFHPGTNFRDRRDDPLNQNGIVFFPGSAPLYTEGAGVGGLVGGLGVSGDGVDQDDVVTFAATQGFFVPPYVPRADDVQFRGVRLPYQKFNRQPLEPS